MTDSTQTGRDRPLRLFRRRQNRTQPVPPHLCEHLREMAARDVGTPTNCADHTEADGPTVSLRACLTCGNVGCCDSSKPQHATAHSRATGHAVIQSAEAGESWRWCYVHEILG